MLLMRVAYVEKTTPSLKSVGSPSTLRDTHNVSFDAPILSFMFSVPCLSVQLLAAINDFYVTPNVLKIPGKKDGWEGGREKGEEGKMEGAGRKKGRGREDGGEREGRGRRERRKERRERT